MNPHKSMLLMLLLSCGVPGAQSADAQDPMQLRASISAAARHVAVGKPIWIDFTLTNLSAEPAELIVPGTDSEPADSAMGLPITHAFSGRAFSCLAIEGTQGQRWDVAVDYHPPAVSEVVEIAPHGSVGVSLEVTRYYPVLRSPGRYRLRWEPYGGALRSNDLIVEVAPRKQVTLITDHGEMVMRLLYDDAPGHVESFLSLAQGGFYDNLTFHKIWPGTFIQGGCPLGNGTGIRPDGRKLTAEFHDAPQDRGAVSMARLESDPDSASCQFFIVNTRIPEWDGRYTMFGHLVGEESFETLDRLMVLPVDDQGVPDKRICIRGVRVEDARSEVPTPTSPGF